MQITVKTLDSQTKVFTISDESTVKEFKEHIATDVNIPPDKQRLIFKGKVLQDDKKLSEYGADGCVIHLVERKPPAPGTNSTDGANEPSSSSGQPHGLAPNIVMGAFSMPVDVVGATQQIVQSLVNQLGVDSAQANISTTSSDDGSSVNVHINLQATTQPGNDVLQRINRARHFMRAASGSLNRTEGEGVLPMETSDTPDGQVAGQTQGSPMDAENRTSTGPGNSPAALAEILREARNSMTSMQPALDRYIALLGSSTPENLDPSEDSLPDRIAEAFHSLSHAYHALSDLTFNFRAPEPRRASVLTSLSPHIPQVPMLSSFVGAPQLIPGQASQPPVNTPGPQTPQGQPQQQQQQQGPTQAPPQASASQQSQGTNQNLRIHVNPQGGISFTTIISNMSRANGGAPSATQGTSSTTSTSGSRMSASADNGATQETFSSSFGGQRSSVGTNTNGSSTSTSTQTSQPGVRTRIIIDDFIALISNVPASMAAAAASAQAQGQPSSGIPQGSSSQSQGTGTGQVPMATSQAQPQSQPQSQPQPPASQVFGGQTPTQGGGGTQGGQGPGRPQTLPGGMSFGLLPVMGAGMNSNHPDPLLPCQSFHFGPQAQRPSHQRTGQQSPAQQAREQGIPANPAEPAPGPQETATGHNHSASGVAPAAVQALMGMLSNFQSRSPQGFPPFMPPAAAPTSSAAGAPPRESAQRSAPEAPQRQGADPMSAAETRRSMMDFLSTVMSDIESHSQGGQSQTVSQLIQAMRSSGLDIRDEEGLVPALFQRLSTVLTVEDIMGVVIGSNAPYQQMQPALMVYMQEDILHGNEATYDNITSGVEELSIEIVDSIAESLQSVQAKEGIDIIASCRSFLKWYIKIAADLVLNSDGNPNFAEYFHDHMRDLSAEFFTLLVFCFQDGMAGVEQLIRNRVPQSPLTANMDEHAREMIVQLLLRHVRQMYVSRAYCGPRLARFMIRFPEPQPTPPVPTPSETVSSTVKTQVVDEEMDSHESDDSETFGTPPASLVAAGDSPRQRPEGREERAVAEERTVAEEAMVDEYDEEDWKTIVPEEWIPVITTDIVRQRRLPPQAPFSDAYMNGLPPKRRKVVDQRGITPSEDSIPDALLHAAAAAGATPITSVEDLSRAARENRALQGAYRREVQREVKTRLDKDTDYNPDKFPQTRDYFDRDTQGN